MPVLPGLAASQSNTMPCVASHHSGQALQVVPKMGLNFSGAVCLTCTLFTTVCPGLFPPIPVAGGHQEPWWSHSAVALWSSPKNLLPKMAPDETLQIQQALQSVLCKERLVKVRHGDVFAVFSFQFTVSMSSVGSLVCHFTQPLNFPCVSESLSTPESPGEPSRLPYSFLCTVIYLFSFSLIFSLPVSSLIIPRDSLLSLSSSQIVLSCHTSRSQTGHTLLLVSALFDVWNHSFL